jgi:chorismate-pyruvate lyase
MTTNANSRAAVQPLDEFYLRQRRTLPAFTVIEPDQIPEPYRSLLVHERDMTRTLEQFHGGQIHLRVLSSYREGDAYWRESVLELDGSDQPIEFGAIKIQLTAIPEPWRAQIVAARRPFGGILNASGLRYTSRPSAYLRFVGDDFIAQCFGVTTVGELYGRQNTLRGEGGEVLAEIVEILPLTAKG